MRHPLKLLLAEDSETDARLVLRAVQKAGHVVEAKRVDGHLAFTAALDEKDWDAIVCDWSMPQFGALAALSIVKGRGLEIPFIIVSGTIGEEVAVEAMRAGAHDYLLKGKLTRLAPAIERELRDREMREAHRKSEGALRASEARFSRLAQSGIIGIVTGDVSGEIVEANDAFLRMVGYTRDDLRNGKVKWPVLAARDKSASAARALAQLRATGVAAPYQTEYVCSDNRSVPVLVGIAMLADSHQIAFMIDLTAQKRAEAALQDSEAQLRQAQKMASSAESVGEPVGFG